VHGVLQVMGFRFRAGISAVRWARWGTALTTGASLSPVAGVTLAHLVAASPVLREAERQGLFVCDAAGLRPTGGGMAMADSLAAEAVVALDTLLCAMGRDSNDS